MEQAKALDKVRALEDRMVLEAALEEEFGSGGSASAVADSASGKTGVWDWLTDLEAADQADAVEAAPSLVGFVATCIVLQMQLLSCRTSLLHAEHMARRSVRRTPQSSATARSRRTLPPPSRSSLRIPKCRPTWTCSAMTT